MGFPIYKQYKEYMIKLTKTFTGFTLSILACVSMATPLMVGIFNTKYKVSTGSSLGKARCAVCHTGGKNLNVYGADIKKAMDSSKKLTPEILAKIEGLDSNKNGKTNLIDIKADKNPGVK